MIQALLCWRYLRTRWIALASIVSVTLGVATLVVVNSVMDGFTEEMHKRIHGILSDVVVESHSSTGITDPQFYQQHIRKVLGDDVQGMTTVVTVPAMLTFNYRGQSQTQQINLIGIDQATYASVSDFSQYLLHDANRTQLSFELQETGYGKEKKSFPESGWIYRKQWAMLQKEVDAANAHHRELQERLRATNPGVVQTDAASLEFQPPPMPLEQGDSDSFTMNVHESSDANPAAGPAFASTSTSVAHRFDPERETHPGVVLGIGIGSVRYRDSDGEVSDHYFIRPGDDVTIALPGAGTPPRALDELFTVVDLYESQMSEYDSTFAFVPLEHLQKVRGMIDPSTGSRAVSSIQIKLKAGVDLAVARDKLRAAFPPETTMVHVNTWRDSQGPLLAAVQMETTILNILLFMIIAVAGFGILATFFMIVVEKTRDIGVLKSLGTSGAGVANIFLMYGLLLGTTGAGVGAILGLLFVKYINDIAALLEYTTGREVFDPTIYYFTKIPTIVHPSMVVWVILGAVAIAVMASVLPSIRAARMHPVEALRYE